MPSSWRRTRASKRDLPTVEPAPEVVGGPEPCEGSGIDRSTSAARQTLRRQHDVLAGTERRVVRIHEHLLAAVVEPDPDAVVARLARALARRGADCSAAGGA